MHKPGCPIGNYTSSSYPNCICDNIKIQEGVGDYVVRQCIPALDSYFNSLARRNSSALDTGMLPTFEGFIRFYKTGELS